MFFYFSPKACQSTVISSSNVSIFRKQTDRGNGKQINYIDENNDQIDERMGAGLPILNWSGYRACG